MKVKERTLGKSGGIECECFKILIIRATILVKSINLSFIASTYVNYMSSQNERKLWDVIMLVYHYYPFIDTFLIESWISFEIKILKRLWSISFKFKISHKFWNKSMNKSMIFVLQFMRQNFVTKQAFAEAVFKNSLK